MKPTDYLDVSLESVLQNINLDEVSAAARSTPGSEKMNSYEFKEVCDIILLAADTWLARDLQEFSNIQTEQSFLDGKAIIDVVATTRGTMAPFNKYPPGTKTLIDWKTTQSPVDTESFRDRYIGSFQWMRYSTCVPNTTLFIYRGLSRSLDFRQRGFTKEPAQRTREVILKVHPGIEKDVEDQWKGVRQMRDALVSTSPWPKNRQSCNDFSMECPFKSECYSSSTPFTNPSLSDIMSYSKMDLFLRCPERYRLTLLQQQGDSPELDDRGTLFGSMAHAGLANLWQQAFLKRG